MAMKADPKITPLFPLRKRRERVVDPCHVARILEKMAAEYPANSGRRLLLSDAAKLIKTWGAAEVI
jgi:hypothetical protein